jgi:hypothetical protein
MSSSEQVLLPISAQEGQGRGKRRLSPGEQRGAEDSELISRAS